MKKLALTPVSMSSLEIAELTGKQHGHVIRDIEKMFSDAEEDGSKFGGIYKDAYKRDKRCYYLDFDWTLTLITGYNVKLRKAIIARWKELESEKAQEQERLIARKKSSNLYIGQSDSIHDKNVENGKEDKFYHFSNEADMINRIIFGCTSKEYKERHGLKANDPIRDMMIKEELDAINDLQTINASLIKIDVPFKERKKALEARFMKAHNPKLCLLYTQNDNLA